MTAAKIAWVPVSSSASRRSWGKPLLPREAGGRPKCRSSTGRSGTSIVVPSKLTSRRPRYHAPGVPGSASGRASRRNSSRNGASPRRTRAWVMADLHAKSQGRPVPVQPAQSLDQFPQHGVIRGVSIERQSHHVIDDDARQQLTRTPILSPGLPQNRIHHDRPARTRARTPSVTCSLSRWPSTRLELFWPMARHSITRAPPVLPLQQTIPSANTSRRRTL